MEKPFNRSPWKRSPPTSSTNINHHPSYRAGLITRNNPPLPVVIPQPESSVRLIEIREKRFAALLGDLVGEPGLVLLRTVEDPDSLQEVVSLEEGVV